MLDGTLFGPMDLAKEGKQADVALPPYFPVDRNEAFIPAGTPDRPTTALSKYLGLCWRLHRGESLLFLARCLPALTAPGLQEAGDDILGQIKDPRAARVTAEQALKAPTLGHKQELLGLLARKLDGPWNASRNEPPVEAAIKKALESPDLRLMGIALVAATRDAHYAGILNLMAEDGSLAESVRVAAVEAMGSLGLRNSQTVLDRLVGAAKDQPSSSLVAEAAIRTLPKVYDAANKLSRLIVARDYPLGVRRESLRTLAQLKGGARHIVDMAKAGTLPDDLKTEATTLIQTTLTLDRRLREEAAKILPLPRMASGKPLPPLEELLRREGHATGGRSVFFRVGLNSCSSCHRVQGRGQWVGPDLSTISTKYGKDELLRSILNPSAAIGSSFRSLVLALVDGRVVTGLPIEETRERIVIKTADGKRVAVRTGEIDERKSSDVSLMPEGLAQTMGPEELIDLLAFLSSLHQPVSIVGQYHVVGPVSERSIDVSGKIDPAARVPGPHGEQLAWRRLGANAEGLAELAVAAGGSGKTSVYAYTPVYSPVEQPAKLVVETQSDLSVWLGGKLVISAGPAEAAIEPHEAGITLPQGTSTLLFARERRRQDRGAGHSGDDVRLGAARLLHRQRSQP